MENIFSKKTTGHSGIGNWSRLDVPDADNITTTIRTSQHGWLHSTRMQWHKTCVSMQWHQNLLGPVGCESGSGRQSSRKNPGRRISSHVHCKPSHVATTNLKRRGGGRSVSKSLRAMDSVWASWLGNVHSSASRTSFQQFCGQSLPENGELSTQQWNIRKGGIRRHVIVL